MEAPFHWCLRQQGNLPSAPQPRREPDKHPESDLRDRRWYCRVCRYPVARHADRRTVAGSIDHHFSNPAGQVFHIVCLGQAEGCRVDGSPTTEWTWFAGHAWRYALCRNCGEHLGWHYTGGDSSFFGLILNKLVEPEIKE